MCLCIHFSVLIMKAFKLKSEVIHSGLRELRAFDLSSLSIYASFKFYLRWLCHNCLCYLSIKDVVSFLKRFNLFITSLNMKRCPSLRVKIPIPFIMMGAFPFRQIFVWPLEELFLLFLFMISDTWICLWMTIFILLLFTF